LGLGRLHRPPDPARGDEDWTLPWPWLRLASPLEVDRELSESSMKSNEKRDGALFPPRSCPRLPADEPAECWLDDIPE